MPSKLPQIAARVKPTVKKKMEYIAGSDDKTLSDKVNQILCKYVEHYERKFGEILT
jgi:hypothetical protein